MASVLVVGAGIAGLVGARVLEQAGHDVVVVEKDERPGGRIATRHADGDRRLVFDHGAQFVTLREDALAEETQRWRKEGWLVEWFTGNPDHRPAPHGEGEDDEAGAVVAEDADVAPDDTTPDGPDAATDDQHPRYRGAPHLRALPEALAAELADVRCEVRLTAIAHDGRWVATTYDDDELRADALLCTPPAPQALALFGDGDLPDDLVDELRRVTFARCIAVLARPTGSVELPGGHGLVRLPDDDVLEVVADNRAKGISKEPSVTLHATATWSRDHWDDEDDVVGPALVAVARDLLGTSADVEAVHRWRHAAPTSSHDDLAPGGEVPGPLRFAGDAFAGGRVEGAALSGWTAAHRLLEAL